jgi:hypothetical protein
MQCSLENYAVVLRKLGRKHEARRIDSQEGQQRIHRRPDRPAHRRSHPLLLWGSVSGCGADPHRLSKTAERHVTKYRQPALCRSASASPEVLFACHAIRPGAWRTNSWRNNCTTTARRFTIHEAFSKYGPARCGPHHPGSDRACRIASSRTQKLPR